MCSRFPLCSTAHTWTKVLLILSLARPTNSIWLIRSDNNGNIVSNPALSRLCSCRRRWRRRSCWWWWREAEKKLFAYLNCPRWSKIVVNKTGIASIEQKQNETKIKDTPSSEQRVKSLSVCVVWRSVNAHRWADRRKCTAAVEQVNRVSNAMDF